jgi:hypothetical protein
MRVGWAFALIVMAVACTAPPTAQAPTAAPSPSLTSSGILPLTPVDFHCALPVYSYANSHVIDSMLAFPALTSTSGGEGGFAYDRPLGRWLPVGHQAVSPDGQRYAFTEGWGIGAAPRVHVADAATGQDIRVVTMPDAQPYAVADFTSAGIYLVVSYEGTAPGVWLMDPTTGAEAKVSDGYYQRAGAGWKSVIDVRDPNPVPSALDGQPQPNRIDRVDGSGGAVAWIYRPGHALYAVPFAGSPALLVQANTSNATNTTEFWLVAAPGKAVKLAGFSYDTSSESTYLDLANGFFTAWADTHGIWITGGNSLYLVKRSGQVIRVYDHTAYPAGACS